MRAPPQILDRPVQFRANPEVSRRFRFTSTAATATAISSQTILAACGVVADTTTTGQSIYQAVKLNQIEIWAPPASQGTSTTCSVLWSSASFAQPREVSDTSNSVTTPAHVKTSPPSHSVVSGYWTTANSTTMATLIAPAGSIIDVWVSLVMRDGFQTANAAVLVAATVGGVYYCSLDSKTAAGSIYPPVSLSTL